MIVEDDPAVRVLVSAVLSELGYAFVEAGDANSALPIIESEQRIDLLISDVGLPGMNGRQLWKLAANCGQGSKFCLSPAMPNMPRYAAGFSTRVCR